MRAHSMSSPILPGGSQWAPLIAPNNIPDNARRAHAEWHKLPNLSCSANFLAIRVRNHDGRQPNLPQTSYVPFISQARNTATGALGHFHLLTYTEDPEDVPGKYRDAKLAQITRSQTFTKQKRGETQVRETFSAVADGGEVHLALTYQQGGMLVWATGDTPNLPLYSAADPSIVRWYQEDQVFNIVHSEPLKINRVSNITLNVKGELRDVFDGSERVVAIVIQRPYIRQVYVL